MRVWGGVGGGGMVIAWSTTYRLFELLELLLCERVCLGNHRDYVDLHRQENECICVTHRHRHRRTRTDTHTHTHAQTQRIRETCTGTTPCHVGLSEW